MISASLLKKAALLLFYLSKKGIVVVDTQFPDTAQHLIDELKKKSEKPFRLVDQYPSSRRSYRRKYCI